MRWGRGGVVGLVGVRYNFTQVGKSPRVTQFTGSIYDLKYNFKVMKLHDNAGDRPLAI